MQNEKKSQSLSQNFEGLSLNNNSKYDEEALDDAIINAFKGEHKEFVKTLETFLNNFMKGPKNNEVILGMNKYQRKIVHKVCDLYCITRDYVDVNKDEIGNITILKSEQSFIPSVTLEERYQKHLEKNKKQSSQSSNPFANKKISIKTRVVEKDKKPSHHHAETTEAKHQKHTADSHEEHETIKKKNYEEARDRILQGEREEEANEKEGGESKTETYQTKQKKGKRQDGYDPDFDRSKEKPEWFANPIMGNPGGYPMMNQMGPPGMGVPYYPVYQPQFIPHHNVYPPPYGMNNYMYQYQNPPNMQQNNNPNPSPNQNYFQNFPTVNQNFNQKK